MISLICYLVGMVVMVTKERYVEMLQKIFSEDSPDISSESVCVHAGWSTGTHIENGYGKDRFPEKLISLKLEFIWLPRSPYLNTLQLYLWGYMKDEIRKKKF